MTIAIKPRISLELLPFALPDPGRMRFLNSSEQQAALGAIELPDNWTAIDVNDSTEGVSDFSIAYPDGMHARFSSGDHRDLRLHRLADMGGIVRIYENDRPFFTGWTSGQSDSGDRKSDSLTIRGGGIEQLLMEQRLYIDNSNQPADRGLVSTPAGLAARPVSRIESVLNAFTATIKEFKEPSEALSALAREMLKLVDVGTYGGRKFSELFNIDLGVSRDTYTKNFIHIVNFISQARFGNTVRFWDLLASFAKPPLYELFTITDFADYFLDERSGDVSIVDDDSGASGMLVFRKAPIDYMEGVRPAALEIELDAARFSGKSLSRSVADVFSGVHASLGILDGPASTLVNPVTYMPDMFAQFGQSVLPVVLDGVGFPERDETEQGSIDLKSGLQDIQHLIIDRLGYPFRVQSGHLNLAYASREGLAKARILRIRGIEKSRFLSAYDESFYIRGVSTNFRPAGIAQSISVQWGAFREGPDELGDRLA